MRNYLVNQLKQQKCEDEDIIESLEMQMTLLVHTALDIFEQK